MAIREIMTMGAPMLRRKATKVKKVTKEIRALCDDMIETMRTAPGVGLAAPQVGMPLRVIVIELPENENEPLSGKPIVLVNPEIVRRSEEEEEGVEGCLSVPGYEGDVRRAVGVTVKGRNARGKKVRLKATGFAARVFCHEVDHLDGILYVDRITSPEHLRKLQPAEQEGAGTAI